jgi:hypothetical protein
MAENAAASGGASTTTSALARVREEWRSAVRIKNMRRRRAPQRFNLAGLGQRRETTMDLAKKIDTEETSEKGKFERSGSVFEEKIASLYQPDTTLASQYFDSLRRQTELYPEKTLLLAVLEDGIRSFQDNIGATDTKGRQLLAEAEEWIFGDGSDWLFTFENICAILGLNPEYLRKGLRRWKEAKAAREERAHSDAA